MGNNKYKILIVEDEANIRSFIKANLETSDYQPPIIRISSFWISAFRTEMA